MLDWAKKLKDRVRGVFAEAEQELTALEGVDTVDLTAHETDDGETTDGDATDDDATDDGTEPDPEIVTDRGSGDS
ncbi:MAG: hypothetical protein WBG14_12515 [Rhodococcus sp. (in: high G+C Gram-positive bacteria)]|jgi:hypothetical protein|uniref:hypothetical protein n=1 Tax=Rhodococcus sp. I2R TaxID=2855445 RepID=UPI001E2A3A47|nr:hypothetical protein [Rhodococcus sp. I2R]MCC8928349.1 hypothetical protein [Rhodococcus sp. I2R]